MIAEAKIEGVNTPSEDYHNHMEKRGTLEYPMSSSPLREFWRCPSRWKDGYENERSDSMDWGSLLDALVLTPEQFSKRYVVIPPSAPKKPTIAQMNAKKRSPDSQAAVEWWQSFTSEHLGKEFISKEKASEVLDASERLGKDPVIRSFLDQSDKQVWVSAFWDDPDTGLRIPIRCLIDLAPRKDSEFAKCLGDLKSTRNAALNAWARWCHTAGYHIQGAFNQDMYVAATGEDRNTFCFVVQENYPPYQTAKRMLSQDFYELGKAEYEKMLKLYCRCLKTGFWPSYDDHDENVQGWSLIAPEPWMANATMFAPKPTVEDDGPPEMIDIIP